MKNRTNHIFLTVFVLSLVIYAAIVKYGSGTPWEMRFIFSLLAVPMFCLQMLLCRKVRRWIAVIPALILVGAALFFTFGWLTTTGWDSLGYAIFLAFTIAPAVGCILAWVVYGFHQVYKRGDIRG